MWAGLTLLLAGRAQPFSCVEQVLDGPLHVLAGSKVARSWRHAPRPEVLVLPPPLRLRGGEDAGGAAGAAGGRRRRKRKRTRSKHKEIFQVPGELDGSTSYAEHRRSGARLINRRMFGRWQGNGSQCACRCRRKRSDCGVRSRT